jgi:hypothetical protein
MQGTLILVTAVALFVISLFLERVLQYLAARRRQQAARRAASAWPIDSRGMALPSQTASFSADADGRPIAPGGEINPDHRA